MLRLEWIEEQLEHLKSGTCTMQTVRDYALLCIARDSLRGEGKPLPPYEPDLLGEVPTLDQAERALGAVVINSETDKKRMQDLMTWKQIIKGDN